MFFAHMGAAMVAKKITPTVPLGVLIPVALFPDILAFLSIVFTASSFNSVNHTPWTHGLFMSVIWSIGAFLITLLICRSFRTGIIVGLLLFSHWVLDFISWPIYYINGTEAGTPLLFDHTKTISLGLYATSLGSIIGEIVGFLFLVIMIFIIKKPTRHEAPQGDGLHRGHSKVLAEKNKT